MKEIMYSNGQNGFLSKTTEMVKLFGQPVNGACLKYVMSELSIADHFLIARSRCIHSNDSSLVKTNLFICWQSINKITLHFVLCKRMHSCEMGSRAHLR